MNDASTSCPSCGLEFEKHLGLIGVCNKVQELSREIVDLKACLSRAAVIIHEFRHANSGMIDCSDEHLQNMAMSSSKYRSAARAEICFRSKSTSDSTSGDNIKDPTTNFVPQEKGEGEGV